MSRLRQFLPLTLVVLAVCATYWNHFQNGFHFDDAHAVVNNPYIRSLSNVPRFFSDATTFSVLPANRTYRPFVSASLAFDYALGHGYMPFWFHLSTFIIFVLQLLCMYALFAAILGKAASSVGAARACALLATAWYGLHPAIAETVNYIIQRGDVFCTVGIVAALCVYVRFPQLRSTGLYLVPFAFALLSKPPAVVFVALLLLYVAMFESDPGKRTMRLALAAVPAALVTAALMALQSLMTPKSYTPSILSATAYRLTQPYVLLRYFLTLFLPIHLNVDTDLSPFASLNGKAIVGILFVAMLLAISVLCARRRELRPVSFGLLWFLIASIPTSVYVLSEVENDHRMFLPFVGLVLAVVWGAYFVCARLATVIPLRVATALAVLLLCAYAYGAHKRNQVWKTDESLWLDDVMKSPQNGRGLMNYGLTQMAKGNYPAAIEYFNRASIYTPNYATLEINLGVVYGAMGQKEQAAAHFMRANNLAATSDDPHFFYGRWLYQSGELDHAIAELQTAVTLNPSRIDARNLLATAYAIRGDAAQAASIAHETLRIAPEDPAARAALTLPPSVSAAYWVEASLAQYKSANYVACIASAQRALRSDPNSALAYNNMGAAYAGLQQWHLAIRNEKEALRLAPQFAVAQNNLRAYTAAASRAPQANTPEELLNQSLRDYQAGQYRKSIEHAELALKLRPTYAEGYNNIAASYSALHEWNNAIAAAQKAVALNPNFQLARNNLAWAEKQALAK